MHRHVMLIASFSAKPLLGAQRQRSSRTQSRAWCRAAAESAERAVVLGGGMAGLSSAQVLSQRFSQVFVLERDTFEHGQAVLQRRPGVPQFQMPHGLLLQGLRCLKHIFPGFEEELLAAGGVNVDWGEECDFRDFGVSFARAPSDLRTVCATRALFEHVVRSLVLSNPRITLLTGTPATNLRLDAERAAVTGVEVKGGEVLNARLVLDASGRSSKVAQWLEAVGWQRPQELVVDANVGYATRIYRIPEGYSGPKAVLCGTRPAGTRSGLLAPIEGGRWNVILGGYNGDHPPADEAGFLAFAQSLPAPTLCSAIASAEPLTPIMRYKATQNVRRVWEEVALPEGLCVMGDSVCALNPIYGQGMTVAAMECLELESLLEERLGGSTSSLAHALQGLSAEFQRRVANTVEGPWSLAVSEDASFAGTVSNVEEVPVLPPEMAKYFQRLALAASQDAELCAQWCTVMHMAEPPAKLFTPEMQQKVDQLATQAAGCQPALRQQ